MLQKRQKVLGALHQIKNNPEDATQKSIYANERRQYKNMMKEKKTAYIENSTKQLVEEAEKDPFVALRPRT